MDELRCQKLHKAHVFVVTKGGEYIMATAKKAPAKKASGEESRCKEAGEEEIRNVSEEGNLGNTRSTVW